MAVAVSRGEEVYVEEPAIWQHQVTHQSGVSTIVLHGELDLACVSAVQELLFDQAQASAVHELRVDLAGVAFLDSTVLGVLVAAFHGAQERGCGFVVVNPSPMARRLLAMTGLDGVLMPS